MPAQSPRNMREWMSTMERRVGQAPAGVRAAIVDNSGRLEEEEEVRNGKTPAAPVELVHETAAYLDTMNRQRVRFILEFPDVTKAIDGTDVTIATYELWGREVTKSVLEETTPAGAGVAVPGLTYPAGRRPQAIMLPQVPDTWNCDPEAPSDPPVVDLPDVPDLPPGDPDPDADPDLPDSPEIPISTEPLITSKWTLIKVSTVSSFRADGFIPNTTWQFRARAIGATSVLPGEWSEEINAVKMLGNTIPPSQPTAPVLKVQRGTITASWNGQSVLGPMPADFKYAILAHGTASSPTKEIARFGREGGFKVVADLAYYTPQFFRVQAVDESGNRSPWSEQAVSYTTPLVDKDIILSTIDAAKTHLKNIDAGVSILPNTVITEHLVVTEEMTAKIANFLHVKAVMLEANEIWADAGFFGVADAKLFRGDAFEGKSFEGGVFTLTQGGMFRTDIAEYEGIKWDSAGIKAWSSGQGNETFTLDAATGNLSVFGGSITGGLFQTDALPSVGIKIDTEGFRAYAPNGGTPTRTFEIDRATGSVIATGLFRTGKAGNFIEMDAAAAGGVLRFWTGGSGAGQGRGTIWARNDPTDGEKLSIAYSTLDDPSGTALPVVVVTPTKAYMRYKSRAIQVWNNAGVEELLLDAEGAAVVVRGNLDMRSGRTTYRRGAAVELAYVGQRPESGTSPDFEIRALEGGIRLVGPLQSVASYSATTTSPANLVVNAAGDISRSSSASRYKLQQQTLAVPDAVLDVKVKDWIDKGEWERAQAFAGGRPADEDGALAFDALNLRRIPGLIAEDLVAKGLQQFVVYGPDGQTEGVLYDRFALAQIAKLIERVKKLELAATNSA